MNNTNNLRIKGLKALISPGLLSDEIPLSAKASQTVIAARSAITNILQGKDKRLVVIVGPCSIHDTKAALEYAAKLHALAQKLNDQLVIIMRVYFEKPRTTVGWKGLINDPELTGSFRINKGLRTARKLLLDINEIGLPVGTEFLDTMIPQYLSDLVAWAAIGARTTESQIHRELTSGLSMPVGFKNGTGGSIQIAVDAVYAASQPHHFLGVTKDGVAAIVGTYGNKDCHIILRGSNATPNYDPATIARAAKLLEQKQLTPQIMVDCSHGNSEKDHTKQPNVLMELAERITQGEQHIFGMMLESNLVAGKQALTTDTPLTYGQSITDACIDWQTTETLLQRLAETISQCVK